VRSRFLLGFFTAALVGCVTVPPLTPSQKALAIGKWPDADEAALAAGEKTYRSKCNECHGLMDGRGLVRNKWETVFEEMANDNAELKDEEKRALYRYLWTLTQETKG
jgi:mono/diheme cytochrome c family protein